MFICPPEYHEKTVRLLLDINRKLDDLTHSYIKDRRIEWKVERWEWKNQDGTHKINIKKKGKFIKNRLET